jgi:hypothetical protein
MENQNMNPNICNDQKTFNKAVSKAIEYEQERSFSWIAVLLWLVCLVWAISIVCRNTPRGSNIRTEHLFFSFIAPPLYIISFYMSN